MTNNTTEYLIYSRKAKIYLLDLDCGDDINERWTTERSLAKVYKAFEEANTVIDQLVKNSLHSKRIDYSLIPIKPKSEGGSMSDFRAKLMHSTTFWREELVNSSSAIEALDKVFKEFVKGNREIQCIELIPKKSKSVRKVPGYMSVDKSL